MFSCIWLWTLLSVSFMSLDNFLSLRKKLLLRTNATGIMKNSTAASLTSILEISNVARTSWATVAAIRGTVRHNVSLTSCTSSISLFRKSPECMLSLPVHLLSIILVNSRCLNFPLSRIS